MSLLKEFLGTQNLIYKNLKIVFSSNIQLLNNLYFWRVSFLSVFPILPLVLFPGSGIRVDSESLLLALALVLFFVCGSVFGSIGFALLLLLVFTPLTDFQCVFLYAGS